VTYANRRAHLFSGMRNIHHKLSPSREYFDRTTFQPRLYFRVFVRAVVVNDQMQRNIAGKLDVDSA
jgi:hypothetical protein